MYYPTERIIEGGGKVLCNKGHVVEIVEVRNDGYVTVSDGRHVTFWVSIQVFNTFFAKK